MRIAAKKLARLSLEAYNKKKVTYAAGGTEVLVRTVRKHTVIAFRGTEFDLSDIIDDLQGYPWWSREVSGFVHRGFLQGVRAIWPGLSMIGEGAQKLVLTGHSKGGAEAILLGAMLTRLDRPPVQIETFGAPRVGFSGLSKILKKVPGKRHRLGDDIVPTVPHRFPLPYRHDRELTQHEVSDGHAFLNHRIADYVSAV